MNKNEIGRKITEKLIELHGSANFKIAFLPYKRSMWNSMESVYEECKAAGADAHCYPIPYLRMKENKEPDYLDSDFSLFGDIAEPIETLDRADYVAIHYQYEDNNFVTNMIPKYFTDALKERYHAKVVYLPYGIGSSTGAFAIQPGCRHIDYAFLENEECAERFIAGWKTQGIDFTGRVFGFGSAKLDVARALPDKLIPEEWSEQLGDRTVILICNSLGPFLTDPYRRMDAYEAHLIRELYEGHAVIFRPHPLLWTTIKSMRPDTAERYNNFIRESKMRDHVIVDESEYLERAIAASDRLIADPTSVILMWRETGKPYKIIE